jgi:nitrate reductase gamma subunit
MRKRGVTVATLFWLVLPYLALAAFVLGHVWRWRYDQFGWKTFRTPLTENRVLRLGAPLVHLGVVAVIFGHVLGLLVPRSWTAAVGISDTVYRLISVTAGTLAGATMLAGLVLLAARRILLPSVRSTTTVMDVVMYAVLGIVVLLGLWATVGLNVVGAGHEYRDTVAVWFRGIFLLRPDPSLMADAPLLSRLHALAALTLLAIWPFTRLVHAWSVPIGVLWQPTQTDRRRAAPRRPALIDGSADPSGPHRIGRTGNTAATGSTGDAGYGKVPTL